MELINLQYIESATERQEYSEQDRRLITVNYINASFGNTQDYVELFIYDANRELVSSNYTVTSYKIGSDLVGNTNQTTTLELDPLGDLRSTGRTRGTYIVHYNFLRNQLNTAAGFPFWIREISSTRTEIKTTRQDVSNTQMSDAFDNFSATLGSNGYYPDFYLNFGQNNLVIAVNAVYIEEDGIGYMLFKLYEPLPLEFDIKSEFWVTTKVAEPIEYQVDIQAEAEIVDTTRRLRGPNFDVDIKQEVGETTPYYNYTSLFSTQISSSLQQLQSYFDERAVRINVDYSNFDNFIHFSSATERLSNFAYKLSLIEGYQASISQLGSLTPGVNTNTLVSSSKATLQSNIDNIITKFDPYEYYLYFTSASTAWPKSNDLAPYTLYSVTSSQALAWLGSTNTQPTPSAMSMLYSASLYDNTNSNGLRYTTPAYLRDDEENEPYLVFLDMIGQHFDNIWLYYKDVTSRFDAQNNPNVGISLDLVGDALRAFGITLYTNTNVSDNIYYSLLGLNETGATLPITSSAYAQVNLASSSLFPKTGDDYLSASIYLPPFENEKINRYVTPLRTLDSGVTSSFQTISPNDLEAEVYKRLYHNLPYLLKTKGTERGVKALIACYGIPDSVLTVHEFGGYDMFTRPEILGIEDVKVYTGSVASLSGNVLSPHVTTQEYNNDNERTSYALEVGFSPADSINADITSSLPNLSVLQLIGNPALQYSSSYTPLEAIKNAYFASNYTSRYNVWDFIRLIKYYNNSLFKMIKDFVPARASLSTGIIVKSHILERNKYARHEPLTTTSSYQQHVSMVSISGSDPDEIKYSTAYTSYTDTPSGSVPVYNIYSFEKYTGEFSGSHITVTDGQAFDQADFSISPTSGSIIGRVNYGALFQNISSSVKSERFLDLDYSTNQVIPVNLGLITKSLDEGRLAIQDPYAPFAQLQDYNYALRRSLLPRYEGSKASSLLYNVYTGPSANYAGDRSYGSTAAIDKIKLKYAYLVDIYSASAFLPQRSNAQIKYLIEDDSNVLNLTKANTNLFDVQNIFKSSETCNISLFEYNESNPYAQLLANNPTLQIFEGGFRYLPILHNLSGSTSAPQTYTLTQPVEISVVAGGSTASLSPDLFTLSASFTQNSATVNDPFPRTVYDYQWYLTAQTSSLAVAPPDIDVTITVRIASVTWFDIATNTDVILLNQDTQLFIPAGNTSSPTSIVYELSSNNNAADFSGFQIDAEIASISGGPTSGTGSISTYYTTQVTSDEPCIFFNTSSQQLVFNSTISEYYNSLGLTFNSTSDPVWAASSLEPVVLPFTLEKGDRISVYDSASRLGWDERFEFTVNNVQKIGTGTGSRLLVDTVPTINTSNLNSGSIDSVTGANFKLCRYIVWKHVPDETNVMLRYNPRDQSLVETGLLFPQYIDEEVKQNAGNTIQKLTANGLITK